MPFEDLANGGDVTITSALAPRTELRPRDDASHDSELTAYHACLQRAEFRPICSKLGNMFARAVI